MKVKDAYLVACFYLYCLLKLLYIRKNIFLFSMSVKDSEQKYSISVFRLTKYNLSPDECCDNLIFSKCLLPANELGSRNLNTLWSVIRPLSRLIEPDWTCSGPPCISNNASIWSIFRYQYGIELLISPVTWQMRNKYFNVQAWN